MAESINKFKAQQNTYLREVQQDKAARKRDLASKQQQDMLELRQYYSDENKKVDQESADTVNHIRSQTQETLQNYSDERRQRIETAKLERDEEHRKEVQESASASAESVDGSQQKANAPKIYNRQAQTKAMVQGHESNKKDDSFYKVQDRGSRFSEKSHGYVIEAYAPEHEKDNIRVSVQRDKAIVSGQRKFGDELQEDGKKISTNNFQTFREEFKFGSPVSDEGMTRERIGDYVRFTIPKLEPKES
jgi:HSP20 family molecular chaperone IbpA